MENSADYNFIRKMGELTHDGIAVYDLSKKKFSYVNENFLAIFDVVHEDLFNQSEIIIKCIQAEELSYLTSRYHELLETGCINTTEFRLVFPGNIVKHICCDVLILENTNLITVFVKDVSQVKIHEDYLIKYTAQKDTLLDMLTHNLSGPLLLSKDIISSIQKGYHENNLSDISKLINIIQENTQQCIDIVNDFLREEHHESALTYVRKTRFDLIEKVNITIDKIREMNKDKVFKVQTPIEILNINSDAVKFFQVIHNLLSNAIKYTPENGMIEIYVENEKDFFTIVIKDNGIGISDDLKPLIFQERILGKTGLKGEKSSGLGLSIAKKLVDMMGGSIWFESKENMETAFYVKLPKE